MHMHMPLFSASHVFASMPIYVHVQCTSYLIFVHTRGLALYTYVTFRFQTAKQSKLSWTTRRQLCQTL